MSERPVVVFGDVHGESKLLESLIQKVRARFGTEVDIYSTGDLIDRGPDSKGVLDICIREGVQAVLGNHELWFHQLCSEGVFQDMALHPSMKGDKTLESYGITTFAGRSASSIAEEALGLIPQEHKDYILNTPVWRKFECDGVIYRLIHAGLKIPDAAMIREEARKYAEEDSLSVDDTILDVISAIQPAALLWTSPNIRSRRDPPDLYKFEDGSVQIFGHIPVPSPILTRHWIALDTGCGTCPPRRLSAVLLPDREILTVSEMDSKIAADGGFSNFSL